ncbi:hypothetical protein M3573_11805 [Bacillus safensis]|uniref:hypothetical protein n=1 Tax=Bacillus safensis TaxID=561879 RepID=UPI0020400B16|nr:hypothetical protein [Bacillus safensis]MCM3138968.1 hypothetical protein [Bacillus safensis]
MKKLSIFGVIIILPMFINLLFTFKLPFVQGSMDNWFSFFGSYSGAIVGGIVAYFISRHQWENHKRNEEENRKINQLFGLISIKSELKKMQNAINIIEDVRKKFISNSDAEYDDNAYDLLAHQLPELDLDNWANINFDDTNLLEKLLNIKDFYIEYRKALSLEIGKLKLEISALETRIYNLKLNGYENDDATFQLESRLYDLTLKYDEEEHLKILAWGRFRDEEMAVEISDCIISMEKKISHINSLKKTREKGFKSPFYRNDEKSVV